MPKRLQILLLGVYLLSITVANAQTRVAEFSFSNPGARSLGLGGAFVALADDATAVYANPAGLVQLTTPEVSLELRSWDYTSMFTAGGRISGEPTGILLDTASGLRTGESSETINGVSFLSFVYPVKRWSVAIYRHVLANLEGSTKTEGLFADIPGPIYGQERWLDALASIDLEILSYGISGAYRITDRLSLGAGIVYFDGSATEETFLYGPIPATLPLGTYGPNAFLPEGLAVSRVQTIDDKDWNFNAGLLWKVTEKWSVGAVYRGAPTLEVAQVVESGPTFPDPVNFEVTGELDFPDVFGLAAAIQLARTTVTAEWDRVRYSKIVSEFGGTLLDDGDELRVGFEYVFFQKKRQWAIRTGVWRDPDHAFRYIGDDPFTRVLLPGGDDEMHYALGGGAFFGKFQIDAAIDVSDMVNTLAVSGIFSF